MTGIEIVAELTYLNYAHNRRLSPHVTVERWTNAYGPTTAEMEARFQREQSAAEKCGMSETQYKHAESLYLHGDLSGR